MTPKNIHKIFIPQKLSFFWKPSKILKFETLKPLKLVWAVTYVWKIRVAPSNPRILWGKVTKAQENIIYKRVKRSSPFLAGDHKAAIKEQASMSHDIPEAQNDPQKKHRLVMVSKIFTGGLKHVNL